MAFNNYKKHRQVAKYKFIFRLIYEIASFQLIKKYSFTLCNMNNQINIV